MKKILTFHAAWILCCMGMICSSAEAQLGKFPSFAPDSTQTRSAANDQGKAPAAHFPIDNVEEIKPIEQAATPTTLEQLAALVEELGYQAAIRGNQVDLLYRADLDELELEVFFSLSLTDDNERVRVCAWLDPLPEGKIASEPLLELLAANRGTASGCHFGYSRQVGRFLLEQTLPNQKISAVVLDQSMSQISAQVSSSWGIWATSEWKTVTPEIPREAELDSRMQDIPDADQFELPLLR